MDHQVPFPKLQSSGSLADVLKLRRKTCADVIRESKLLINYEGLKSVVDTKRPETPLDESENYGKWKKVKSGDTLLKKSANVTFTPVSGIEFELVSRPTSTIKKLDPIDRKVRSASSGAKERNAKQERLSAEPVEAFQNIPTKSTSAGPGRKSKSGSKLKRDCSVNEIKACKNDELNFFVEGKKIESVTLPPKKSRQTFLKQKYENLCRQDNDSKQFGHKINLDNRKRSDHMEEKKPHESNKKPTNTIKINIKIPMPPVSSTSSPFVSPPAFDHNPTIRDSNEAEINTEGTNNQQGSGIHAESNKELNSSISSNKMSEFVMTSGDAEENKEKTFYGCGDGDDNDDCGDGEERFVSMILEDLRISSKIEGAESLNLRIKTFHDELEQRNLLGKNSKHRSRILKFIITLIDLDCQSLNLNVCKMMLALKVSGKNLHNVTKLLLKLSNDKTCIKKFVEENIIGAMTDTSSCMIESCRSQFSFDAIQSLLNILCVMNSLSLNSTTSKYLVTDVMATVIISSFKLAKHLKYVNEPEECCIRMLVLITSISRNLLDVSNGSKILTNAGIIEHLFEALEVSGYDESVTMNAIRVLSKLTMENEYCLELSNLSNTESLNIIMQRFYNHEDIVLRVSFALGNVAAKQDDCRLNYVTIDRHLSTIVHAYNNHLLIVMQKDKHLKESYPDNRVTSSNSGDLEVLKKCEDIMAKLLRLVANLTLNEEVGSKVAEEESLFLLILDSLDYERLSECDELFMNTMALLNNLSFYSSSGSALMKNQIKLIRGLEKFLFTYNASCLSDMIRVFGNMSRDEDARRNLTEVGVDRYLIELLDYESNEIVFSSCGALINFMIDRPNRVTFKKNLGVQRVIGVLEAYRTNDWQLAGMACQILCNYCLGFKGNIDKMQTKFNEVGWNENIKEKENEEKEEEEEEEEGDFDDECCTEALFMSEEILFLKDLLRRYLGGDPPIPSSDDPEMKIYFLEVWKSHFVNVADDLNNKLNNYV